MRAPLASFFRVLSLAHLLSAFKSLFVTSQGDSVPLIVELLSLGACPAGVVLLLRLAGAGSIAASGAALALADGGGPAPGALRAGLVGHAALNLLPGQSALLNYDAFESVMWTLRKRLRRDIGWPTDWADGCRAVKKYFATAPPGTSRWDPWRNQPHDVPAV